MSKVCRRGHTDSGRYKNGECIACRRITSSAYYKKHRERELKRTAERAKTHREETRAACRRWYERNKEAERARKRAQMAEWRKDPLRREKIVAASKRAREKNPNWQKNYFKARPGLKALQHAQRRAVELQACPSWVDKKEIADFYRNRPEGMQVDHIYPLRGKTVCGLHVPWNLQYLTPIENARKNNRLIDQA
jgi:hypothetical protein